MIARTAARLALAVGVALIVAGMVPPAEATPEPVHRRPATEAEVRQWHLDQLSALIDAIREHEQQ